jgi:hypothetical protein
MPGPAPKNPATRQRRNKQSTNAKLSLVVNHEVPPMPDADDWIGQITSSDGNEVPDAPVQWSDAVETWWESIWSSPMSNEYHDADIHQLYLACFYLQQTLNPYLKMSDRLNASKSYEATIKNFGLTPMSRRSLQWEIERSEEALAKGAKRRSRTPEADPAPVPAGGVDDPRLAADEDDKNPFDKSPEYDAG